MATFLYTPGPGIYAEVYIVFTFPFGGSGFEERAINRGGIHTSQDTFSKC